ncbi:MAG: ElyC/SanA/YdcF family protein [Chloracidobacterium sp.]|uniref:YdcF family protein n=1 Tax=Chloracidobacterium validum TaxID=2821543 RepID=A0ABX8BC66_9BACT|nr:ElyC/SanA/YdcF family protein [Chloracidobacterium validum]QUW03224.1 YdcF family protein [Chloracidobacterium validum]
MTDVVLVPGHAVCLRPDTPDLADDEAWWLEPYQRGEGSCYVAHIAQGVRLTAEVPQRWLVFSGGYTRQTHPPQSEAESYRQVAQAQGWWGHLDVAARTLVEDFARDSYENLRFGLYCFRDAVGAWPEQVYVIGWRFKQRRFELHAAALGWPLERLHYIGVNDPPDVVAAQGGEAQTLEAFRADPHGLGERLAAKRATRNPFRRFPPAHWQAMPVLPVTP